MIRLWKYETRSVPLLTRGKDWKGWRSQFRSVAKEWSDSVTLKSPIFAQQKATHIFLWVMKVQSSNPPPQNWSGRGIFVYALGSIISIYSPFSES